MVSFLIALPAAVAVYIIVEYKSRSVWLKLALKTVCSLLFVAIAFSALFHEQAGPQACYGWFLSAFLLSMAGDILLSAPAKSSFALGLGAFFLAQCAFAAAFSLRWGLSCYDIGAFALLAVGALLTLWNARGMSYGKMERPITLYALALSAMAAKAVSGAYLWGGTGAWLAAAGGLLFYASDVILAFVLFNSKKPKCLRALNLALYYAGQGLLAASLMFQA